MLSPPRLTFQKGPFRENPPVLPHSRGNLTLHTHDPTQGDAGARKIVAVRLDCPGFTLIQQEIKLRECDDLTGEVFVSRFRTSRLHLTLYLRFTKQQHVTGVFPGFQLMGYLTARRGIPPSDRLLQRRQESSGRKSGHRNHKSRESAATDLRGILAAATSEATGSKKYQIGLFGNGGREGTLTKSLTRLLGRGRVSSLTRCARHALPSSPRPAAA